MNKCINQRSSERGITLIALIVMIAIIVIIASISIANLTGNHNLIDVTTDVANNYEVTSYKEQIEQVVYSTIIAHSARGEVATLTDIADDLNNQDWVRSATANTDTSISNGDIIVIVDKGYIFQVFYDSVYGKVIVEYIGRAPEDKPIEDIVKSFPTVKARYEEKSIFASAKEEKNGIEKIEIIYQGEIIQTKANPSQTKEERFDVSKYGNGLYKVKATANNTGIYRYAYVYANNISGRLAKPSITLLPSTADGQNGWYKTAASVTITTETEYPIHYRVVRNGITRDEETDITYSEAFTIDTVGQTKIYAWIQDEDKDKSEEAEEIIKLDNIPPQITNAVIKGTEGENRWITSKTAQIEITAEDNVGGIVQGYTYEVYNMDNVLQKTSNGIIPIERAIPVETDGEWKILIKAVDEAGNISVADKTVEVHKDSERPSISDPSIENKKGTSFTIIAVAGDETSKVAKYEYYINSLRHGENTTRNI